MATILFVVISFFVISFWQVIEAILVRKAFRQKFPPITDAEFIARCGPGTDSHVALRVRKIVADSLGLEYQSIYPSSRFVEDLDAD